MIIDIHTHTFPDKIAEKAIPKLAYYADTKNYSDGKQSGLLSSMESAQVDMSVLLPVATSPKQTEKLNQIAIEQNQHITEGESPTLLSFGAIHPENANYKEILNTLAREGVKGIKIHPVYQECDFDDLKYLRIVEYAASLDLAIMVHAGYDVGYPGSERVVVSRILSVLDQIQPDKMILAHMGGWDDWDMVEDALCGRNVYFDTAFTLTPLIPMREKLIQAGLADQALSPEERKKLDSMPRNWHTLSEEQFVRIIQKHGADKILFGSDSPWDSQQAAIDLVRSLVDADTAAKILGENAERLLFS